MNLQGLHRTEPVSARHIIVIILLVIVAIVLRAPNLFYDPRFWAEEAFVYFATAQQLGPLEALFKTHLGYYALWPNVAGILASFAPMEHAPFVTLVMSLLVQLLPVVLILTARIPVDRKTRLLMVTAYLLVVPTGEAWLNTINSQFFFAISATLMIALPSPKRFPFLSVGVLLGMGLSSPIVCFLGPVALLAAIQERALYRFAQLAVLGVATLVQIGVILSVSLEGRVSGFDVGIFFVFAVKQIILLFTGFVPARFLTNWAEPQLAAGTFGLLPTVLLATIYLGFAWALFRLSPTYLRRAVPAVLILSILTSLAALGSQIETVSKAERYYTPPTLLFAIVLACVAGTRRDWVGRLALSGVICGIAIGAAHYFLGGNKHFGGPSWREEVRAYQANPEDPIVIWPSFWVYRPSDPVSEKGSWPTVEEVRGFGATRLDGKN